MIPPASSRKTRLNPRPTNMATPRDVFSRPPRQGRVGRKPKDYFADLRNLVSNPVPVAGIPGKGRRPLTRQEVRQICRDQRVDPLVAYACAMAWGFRNFHNYRLTLQAPSVANLRKLIDHLRTSNASRQADFAHAQKQSQSIKGLNISFYTKLLFFFRKVPDAYILDQWTAKSAVLMNPGLGIELTSSGLPKPSTSPKVYEGYCSWLDQLAHQWSPNWTSGEEVERTLFDSPSGPWRGIVRAHFPSKMRNMNRPLPPGNNPISAMVGVLNRAFQQALQQGRPLPGNSVTFHPPNRGFCQSAEGVVWQFTLSKDHIHAQVHLTKAAVHKYADLVARLGPTTVGKEHHFAHGIIGNGPRGGVTRSLNLPVDGGYANPRAQWPALTKAAVDAMETLFDYLSPHL